MIRRPPRSTRVPYTTLVRSQKNTEFNDISLLQGDIDGAGPGGATIDFQVGANTGESLTVTTVDLNGSSGLGAIDRKSTRLNSSHANISYAVFCLKKKKSIPTLLRHQHIYGPPISTLKLNDTMQARYFRTFVSLLTSSRWHL